MTFLMGIHQKGLVDWTHSQTHVDIGAYEVQSSCSNPSSRKDSPVFTEIHPNPMSNLLFVETSLEDYTIKIYDLLGKIVQESKTKEMNVSHLSQGIYILNVFQDGKLLKVEKVVKR